MKIPPGGKPNKSVVIEIKYGPSKKGPKMCLRCRTPFNVGDCWQMVWDPAHDYAVGIHTRCIALPRKNHGNSNKT